MIDLDSLHVEVAADGLVVPHATRVLVSLEFRIGFSKIEDLVARLESIYAVRENVVVAGTTECVLCVELSLVVDDLIDDRLELSHSDSLRDRDCAVPWPVDVADEARVGLFLQAAVVEAESGSGLGHDVVVDDIVRSDADISENRVFIALMISAED